MGKDGKNMNCSFNILAQHSKVGIDQHPGGVWNTFYDGWLHFVGLQKLSL